MTDRQGKVPFPHQASPPVAAALVLEAEPEGPEVGERSGPAQRAEGPYPTTWGHLPRGVREVRAREVGEARTAYGTAAVKVRHTLVTCCFSQQPGL